APNVAHGSSMLFENFVNVLRELFAAFFSESGNGNSDQSPIVGWIQAQIRCSDGFFDWTDERNVVRLNRNQRRFGRCELRNLVYRSGNSIVIDLNIGEDRDRGAAGSDRRQFLANIIDGLFHSFPDLRNLVFNSHKGPLLVNQGADLFSFDDPPNVAFRLDVENDYRNVVIFAQRNSRAVHDTETLSQNIHIRDLAIHFGVADFHG